MMTALTTVIGMVPLAVAQPMQMGLSYRSFGLTLIGGMITATLLTMLVVPVFYTLIEDGRAALARAASAAVRPSEGGASTQGA
jgi:HAE1 family hydrophobic/amphiphilic exporter-1